VPKAIVLDSPSVRPKACSASHPSSPKHRGLTLLRQSLPIYLLHLHHPTWPQPEDSSSQPLTPIVSHLAKHHSHKHAHHNTQKRKKQTHAPTDSPLHPPSRGPDRDRDRDRGEEGESEVVACGRKGDEETK
jgi:hypothetical protein